MTQKSTLLKGAAILALTGLATRFIGFFYRIFLGQSFAAEGMGLYQLIFPIYALGLSLTSAGLETAVSKNTAEEISLKRPERARTALYTGLTLSVFFSIILTLLLQRYAVPIARHFLKEPRCIPLLYVLSYTFPFAAVHSCICGYYLGMKRADIPALSLLIEQAARVLGVYILYLAFLKRSMKPTILIAAAGLVIGEIFSSACCLKALTFKKRRKPSAPSLSAYKKSAGKLLVLSAPLTANRVLLNLLQGIEAVSIPSRLCLFGFTSTEALSIYGVLTGMALPCVLFPCAATASISAMLLPAIAELQALNEKKRMKRLIQKAALSCFFLGLACGIFLLAFGRFAGIFLFHSPAAGQFIVTLSWICPFLYTNNIFMGIINGLGKTYLSFFFNALGLLVRIGSIFLLIPLLGVRGYLLGLLISQLLIFLLCAGFLKRHTG